MSNLPGYEYGLITVSYSPGYGIQPNNGVQLTRVRIRPYNGVLLTRVRNTAVCDELSQQNAEGPDVRLDGELAVVGCLRRRPLDREPVTKKTHHKYVSTEHMPKPEPGCGATQ